MKSLPYEIELMEQLAKKLNRLADKGPEDSLYYSCFFNNTFDRPMRKVILWLEYNKPSVAKSTEEEYNNLVEYADSSNAENGQEIRLFTDFTKRSARYLAEKLQRISQMAKDELTTEKPTEVEQKTTPAKHGRIGTWLWKLYEKTLKVIVDAVFERLWPK